MGPLFHVNLISFIHSICLLHFLAVSVSKPVFFVVNSTTNFKLFCEFLNKSVFFIIWEFIFALVVLLLSCFNGAFQFSHHYHANFSPFS